MQTSGLVDTAGKPLRSMKDDRCPRCGASAEHRQTSGAFGQEPHPICAKCGHEFFGERA